MVSLTTASQLKALGLVSHLIQVLILQYRLAGVFNWLNEKTDWGNCLAHFRLTVTSWSSCMCRQHGRVFERPRWSLRLHVTTWMNTVKTQHSVNKWHTKDQYSMTLLCRVPRSRMYRQQGTGTASCWAGEHRELVRGEGYTVRMCSVPLTCALKSDRSDKRSVNSTMIKRGFKGCCPK